MASTGILKGTRLVLYVNNVAIAHSTSHTFNFDTNMLDASSKDSNGWADFICGQNSWSIDFESLFAMDAAYGLDELIDLQLNRTLVTLKFSTEETGDIYFTGSAYLQNTSLEAPNEEVTTYSGSFQGTGALTKSTVA